MNTSVYSSTNNMKRSILANQKKRGFLFAFFIILIIAIISAITTLVHIRRIQTQSRESTVQSLVSALDFSRNNTELLISTCISQPMLDLERSPGIIALSFSSSGNRLTYSKIAKARTDINAMITNSPLIEDALIYVQGIDSVVSCLYPVTGLDSSEYADMISAYESATEFSTVFRYYDANVVMFRFKDGYVAAKPLYETGENIHAVLFAVIDADELGKFVRISSDDFKNIFLFDGDDLLIYPNDAEISFILSKADSKDSAPKNNVDAVSNGTYYISRYSEDTSLTFVVATNADNLNPSPASFLSWLAFGAAIFVLLVSIYLLTISFVRKPYRQAISKLKESGISDNDENEIDFMNNTISTIINKQEKLNSMLQTVSQDVEEKIFYDLLHNSIPSYDNAANILTSISSNFRINAFYCVCIIKINTASETELSQLYWKELISYLNNSSEKNDFTYKIINDEGSHVIIIQINDLEIQYPPALHIVRNLESNINRIIYPYGNVALGHLYRSLFDITFSYNEAKTALGNRILAGQTSTGSSLKENEYDSLPTFFEHRSEQIVSALQNERSDNGLQMMIDEIFRYLYSENDDIELSKSNYNSFISILLKKMLSFPFVNEAKLSEEYDNFSKELSKSTDSNSIIGLTHATVHSLISIFKDRLGEQNNPYILNAQSFISENYVNPDLTVGDIADHVHISSNYLSKLFKEALNMTLLEYLTYFRIQRSIDQLNDKKLTITQIAEKNGFSSVRNYIRSFKNLYDTTPGEYRKF